MVPLPFQSSDEDDTSEDGQLASATKDARPPVPQTAEELPQISCQDYYQINGYSKPLLVLLCLGLSKGDNDSSPLFDLESPPWNKKQHKKLKPKQADFVNETLRRQACRPLLSEDKELLAMKPKNKTRSKLIAFLKKYPVTNPVCISFLKIEVERLAGIGSPRKNDGMD